MNLVLSSVGDFWGHIQAYQQGTWYKQRPHEWFGSGFYGATLIEGSLEVKLTNGKAEVGRVKEKKRSEKIR